MAKTCRRRFGLRTLLLMVALSSAASGRLGRLCVDTQRSLQAERAIRRAGGILIYASRWDPKVTFRNGTPLHHWAFHRWPGLRAVVEVRLLGGEVDQELLAHISKLPGVRRVSLAGCATRGDSLRLLVGLRHLEQLDLQGTALSNACLEPLGKLPGLSHLNLANTCVSDEGLPFLAKLKNLRTLGLDRTAVTASGRRQLQRALPNVHIVMRPRSVTAS